MKIITTCRLGPSLMPFVSALGDEICTSTTLTVFPQSLNRSFAHGAAVVLAGCTHLYTFIHMDGVFLHMNTLQPHPVCRPTFPILHLRHLAGTPIERKLAWIEQQAELQILCDWCNRERGGSNARSGLCAVVRRFSWLFRAASYGKESGRKRNKGFVKESESEGGERKCDLVCHSLESHFADVIWWDKMALSP